LRAWDLLWNRSHGELEGRVLTVYDVGDEQTLLAHVVLSEAYQAKRLSDTDFQIFDRTSQQPVTELAFQWNCPDGATADAWLRCLEKACTPVPPQSVVEQAPVVESSEIQVTDSLDSGLLMSIMLTPSLLGGSMLDTSVLQIISECWAQVLAYAMGSEEEAQAAMPGSPVAAPRSFRSVTLLFEACLLGDSDVDAVAFIAAATEWVKLIAVCGNWAVMLGKEVYKNSVHINGEGQELKAGTSLRELVRLEACEPDMHTPGAIQDPSRCLGVLWHTRGLMFWVSLGRCCQQAIQDGEPQEALFKACFDQAYEKTLKRYHGPVVRTVYDWGTRWLPAWDDVWSKLFPSQEDWLEENRKMSEAMEEVIARMSGILIEHDLHDNSATL